MWWFSEAQSHLARGIDGCGGKSISSVASNGFTGTIPNSFPTTIEQLYVENQQLIAGANNSN
jgi:serine/threonine protein phosphatase PrpC